MWPSSTKRSDGAIDSACDTARPCGSVAREHLALAVRGRAGRGSQDRGLGYGAVWIGENHANREIFAHAATLLGSTERIVVATGVAGIWSRDPSASANGAAALAEAFPGRFVLTLGVSHAPIVARRGHAYEKPLAAMREHLDGMAATRYARPGPGRARAAAAGRARARDDAPRGRANRRRAPVLRHAGAHRGARETLGRERSSPPSKGSCSWKTRRGPRDRAGAPRRLPPARELHALLAAARLRRRDSGTAAATVSWTRSSRGETRRPWRPAFVPIWLRVPITCPCRRSAPIRSRSSSGSPRS